MKHCRNKLCSLIYQHVFPRNEVSDAKNKFLIMSHCRNKLSHRFTLKGQEVGIAEVFPQKEYSEKRMLFIHFEFFLIITIGKFLIQKVPNPKQRSIIVGRVRSPSFSGATFYTGAKRVFGNSREQIRNILYPLNKNGKSQQSMSAWSSVLQVPILTL